MNCDIVLDKLNKKEFFAEAKRTFEEVEPNGKKTKRKFSGIWRKVKLIYENTESGKTLVKGFVQCNFLHESHEI